MASLHLDNSLKIIAYIDNDIKKLNKRMISSKINF